MFHTFAASPGRHGRRKPKVLRACNHCRLHRVRCDTKTPCSQCVTNNVKCIHSSPVHCQQISLEQSIGVDIACAAASPDNTAEQVPVSRPLLPEDLGQGPLESNREVMDSAVGFMGRISDFCDSLSQYLSRSTDDRPPPYPSPDSLNPSTDVAGNPVPLPKTQLRQLLGLYWAKLHCFLPILNRDHVESLVDTHWTVDGASSNPASLLNGIVAICFQYLHCSGKHTRLLGLFFEQPEDHSLHYFRRCLATSDPSAALSQPTLDQLLCYLLMTHYLLEGGQYQTAYNMIGLATRIAYSLNLHGQPVLGNAEDQPTRRIWWTTVHLNVRCAYLLGRPTGLRLADTTCPLPNLGAFPYHEKLTALTKTTLQLTECYEKYTLLADADHLTQAEQRASGLSAEIHRLQEWRDHCMPAFTEHPLLFQKNKGSDRMMEAVFQMDSANPSKLLQESLLELQYYDVMIGFHRPFICFPNRSLIPQRSPQADKHATTALELAMASVNLTHCVMSASDVFHGRSDIYQWLWNSVLTIIGFLLAHPLCEHSSSATRHIQLASEMFDAAKKRSIVATRAAALTSFLASKVSSLVEIVKSSSSPISAGTGQGTGQGTGAGGTSEGEHMLNKSSEYEYLGWAHSMSDPETWACTTRKLQGF